VLLLAAVVIGIGIVPLTGGRLGALAHIPLRANALLAVAMTVQVAVITVVPGGTPGVHAALHVATYGLSAVWVFLNRHIAFIGVAAAGAALNTVVIVANRGVMPAAATAMARAGLHPSASRFANSGVQAHPHLAVLGDIFAVPRPLPLSNVYSLGDIVLALGVVLMIASACRAQRPARLRSDRPSKFPVLRF
jgi:hypothetical protein